MSKVVWEQTSTVRFMAQGAGFIVSFVDTSGGIAGIKQFAGDGNGLETALVKDENSDYFILNGDYRKQYEELITNGWDACKKFFDDQPEEARSSWSA